MNMTSSPVYGTDRLFVALKRLGPTVLLLSALSLGLAVEGRADPTPTPTPFFEPTPTPTPIPLDPTSPDTSSGPVTVAFDFDGSDTTVTFTAPTGALAGLTFNGFFSGSDESTFTGGNLVHTSESLGYDKWVFGGTSSPDWGTGSGSELMASSTTGDVFAIISNGFLVPEDYDLWSGNALTGSMTFLGTSLADLGFGGGAQSGSFIVAGTTVNWTSAVPEPGTTALLASLAAFGLVALGRSRRRAAQRAQK